MLQINLRNEARVIVADAINEVTGNSVGGKTVERNVDGNGSAVIARESMGLTVHTEPTRMPIACHSDLRKWNTL